MLRTKTVLGTCALTIPLLVGGGTKPADWAGFCALLGGATGAAIGAATGGSPAIGAAGVGVLTGVVTDPCKLDLGVPYWC